MKGTYKETTVGPTESNRIEQKIEDHRCDRCDVLFLVPDLDSIQPYDALEIEFHPYYAGYFDQSGPEDHLSKTMYRRFWLCEACANILIMLFPCMKVNR